MGKMGIILMILILGAIILCPVVMAFEPEPLPGDFAIAWGSQHFVVPVAWSLCASGALALFYAIMKR